MASNASADCTAFLTWPLKHPCSGNGQCVDGLCVCSPGWTGKGDFDFRGPNMDGAGADCDKYIPALRGLCVFNALSWMLVLFLSGRALHVLRKKAKRMKAGLNKADRSKRWIFTTLAVASAFVTVMYAGRALDPEAGVGISPFGTFTFTLMLVGLGCLWLPAAANVMIHTAVAQMSLLTNDPLCLVLVRFNDKFTRYLPYIGAVMSLVPWLSIIAPTPLLKHILGPGIYSTLAIAYVISLAFAGRYVFGIILKGLMSIVQQESSKPNSDPERVRKYNITLVKAKTFHAALLPQSINAVIQAFLMNLPLVLSRFSWIIACSGPFLFVAALSSIWQTWPAKGKRQRSKVKATSDSSAESSTEPTDSIVVQSTGSGTGTESSDSGSSHGGGGSSTGGSTATVDGAA